jgi:hypothetical protein
MHVSYVHKQYAGPPLPGTQRPFVPAVQSLS